MREENLYQFWWQFRTDSLRDHEDVFVFLEFGLFSRHEKIPGMRMIT